MARQRKAPVNVTARRERVWDWFLQGIPAAEMARREKIDRSQICRDLADLQAERKRPDKEAAAALALARYERVMAEAWSEWERSKLDRERSRQKETKSAKPTKKPKKGAPAEGPADDGRMEAESVVEGRLGDPQYLANVIKAQQQIDGINGIRTPDEVGSSVSMTIKCYGFNPFARPNPRPPAKA
jgi:hypothetical protein